MTTECYAQRLLNPFRGAMHIIRYASAEAVTTDGVHWDIYVANERLLDDDPDNRQWTHVSDIRYGSWSAAKGLKRGPLYPSEDFRRMEEMGAIVYEHLTRVHQQVPFAFKDHFELWLLDPAHQPLALLHSAVGESDLKLDHPVEWRAGFAASERFTSPAMRDLAGTGQTPGDYLTGYVNARAGAAPAAQWFRREPDGTGTGLHGIGLPPALTGRSLPEQAFPPLYLSAGHDNLHRRLIEDFHAWQAVWLLVLPQLSPPVRRALEQQARRQALIVESQYRLYPEVFDEAAIKAALVEAVLRRSQPQAEGKKEDALSTFYIELSANPRR